MSNVIVRVNGNPFGNFKQINISKDIDAMSGHMQIVVSEPADDLSIFQINDFVTCFLDGFQVFGGYMEKVEDNETEENHDISFSFRESVMDLIDSTVPQAVRIPTSYIDFSEIINAVLTGLNLDLIIGLENQIGSLPIPYNNGIPLVKAAEMGTTAGEYLNECARICSCIMNTSYNDDTSINILIRNFTIANLLKTMLLFQSNGSNNNILDSSLEIDYSDRFGKIICWSNGNIDYYQQNSGTGLGWYSGSAVDDLARSTRLFEFFPETPLQNSEYCTMRANEEVNLRRARSFKYVVKVQGFSANGQLWDIGQLARVQDDKRRVYGYLLIKSVQYEYTLTGGAITTMTLTYPDAYGVTLTNLAGNALDPNNVSVGVTYNSVLQAQNWQKGKTTKTIANITKR